MLVTRVKNYMPRSLFGRAALILLLPVFTLLTVVSVVFVQRLYDEVTQQMTRSVAYDLRFVLAEISAAPEDVARIATQVAAPLGVDVSLGAGPAQDARQWMDFSGRVVTETLRQEVPQIGAVDLSDLSGVVVTARTAAGPAELRVSRRRVSARNPHQLLVIMGTTALVMTVVSFLYLRGQIRPIRRLAAAAEAFGRGQATPYRPQGAAEVRAAGGAFLDMRNRIERQIEQRTLMLSGVSHDLRTPLTRMKLALSMMDETAETRDLARDVAEMEGMLTSFLDFARSDALDDPEPVDPVALVSGIVEDAVRGGQAAELGRVEGAGDVMLRPLAIRRALENLVGNAVRYGTRARVGLRLTDRALTFRVEDDGPSIPADQREAALKPFQRLDASRNQDEGSGVGLGMAIAADIARTHGGVLRLSDSDALGGLCAELVIPRTGTFE